MGLEGSRREITFSEFFSHTRTWTSCPISSNSNNAQPCPPCGRAKGGAEALWTLSRAQSAEGQDQSSTQVCLLPQSVFLPLYHIVPIRCHPAFTTPTRGKVVLPQRCLGESMSDRTECSAQHHDQHGPPSRVLAEAGEEAQP